MVGSKVCRKNDKLDVPLWITEVSKCFWPERWFGIDWITGGLSVTVVVKSTKEKYTLLINDYTYNINVYAINIHYLY